jgi:hypothetical protein
MKQRLDGTLGHRHEAHLSRARIPSCDRGSEKSVKFVCGYMVNAAIWSGVTPLTKTATLAQICNPRIAIEDQHHAVLADMILEFTGAP